ncbi:MAG TPA: SapC family protein [Pirellulaceae bacterium]|nr:SapC family protein [Pirellulaceae bacterium]
MVKQLLIYNSAVPLSSARHANVSVDVNDGYAFSASVNAVPLLAVEFPRASSEYAIVFTADGDDVMPAVVLGVRNEQNLYLSPESHWKADYIPAFIRRYPFIFSSGADGKSLTLCIDESHPGVNWEGRGNALFGPDAKPTPYVEKVLDFLKQFQAQFERTRRFCRRIKDLQLLEPMQATVTTPTGEQLSLGGFLAVSRDKLRALSGEILEKLAKNDELELLYLHLSSLRNFNEVKERLIGALAARTESRTDAPSQKPAAE